MSSPPQVNSNLDSWMPLYLSTIAGASTCLGAAVVFCHPKNKSGTRVVSNATLSFSLALAGAVMATVSVVSIAPECLLTADNTFVSSATLLYRTVSFGLGCLLFYVLTKFAFPEEPEDLLAQELINTSPEKVKHDVELDTMESPASVSESSSLHGSSSVHGVSTTRSRHTGAKLVSRGSSASLAAADDSVLQLEPLVVSETEAAPSSPTRFTKWSKGTDLHNQNQRRAWRVAILLFISLLCHNFPEGLAVAASALESEKLGIAVTVGIMIHNIPEGIAIAVPCLAARPDQPWLAFVLASASGLAEPLGALVALWCLRDVARNENDAVNSIVCLENVLAFVAGIMVTVALYQLFPEAKRYASEDKLPLIAGTIVGTLVMVVTEKMLP